MTYRPNAKPPASAKLPTELLGEVFQYLPPRQKARVCRLCKAARVEAERTLYTCVDAPWGRESGIALLRTIANVPRIAEKIEAFHLQVSPWMLSVLDLVASAFTQLVNLTDLTVVFQAHSTHLAEMPIQRLFQTLHAAPFRLSRLSLLGFRFADTLPLLHSQPDILDWTHTEGEVLNSPPSDLLPRVEVVHIHPHLIRAFASSRPISRMRIPFGQENEGPSVFSVIESLSKFRRTLRVLDLERRFSVLESTRTSEVLTKLAETLPNLHVLVLSDQRLGLIPLSRDHADTVDDILTAISQFTRLKSILLHRPDFNHRFSTWYRLWRGRVCDEIGDLFMAACPSLNLVAIPANQTSYDYVGFERMADEELHTVTLDRNFIRLAWRTM
ncbi:hypothetical protein JAAARDRAFT_71028 [Jaapia argillacea MUCL 33604]|uniref:F-box domain-containing protein n=1 Tax=Jaapia argillacea MUCL 33604 TaxID=933084 RepID=A0A067PL88_9AGAM|nr:hypothetical protein JAAARDRAFT_71028 [Jaapia argillacea MUCL 33604]